MRPRISGPLQRSFLVSWGGSGVGGGPGRASGQHAESAKQSGVRAARMSSQHSGSRGRRIVSSRSLATWPIGGQPVLQEILCHSHPHPTPQKKKRKRGRERGNNLQVKLEP